MQIHAFTFFLPGLFFLQHTIEQEKMPSPGKAPGIE